MILRARILDALHWVLLAVAAGGIGSLIGAQFLAEPGETKFVTVPGPERIVVERVPVERIVEVDRIVEVPVESETRAAPDVPVRVVEPSEAVITPPALLPIEAPAEAPPEPEPPLPARPELEPIPEPTPTPTQPEPPCEPPGKGQGNAFGWKRKNCNGP